MDPEPPGQGETRTTRNCCMAFRERLRGRIFANRFSAPVQITNRRLRKGQTPASSFQKYSKSRRSHWRAASRFPNGIPGFVKRLEQVLQHRLLPGVQFHLGHHAEADGDPALVRGQRHFLARIDRDRRDIPACLNGPPLRHTRSCRVTNSMVFRHRHSTSICRAYALGWIVCLDSNGMDSMVPPIFWGIPDFPQSGRKTGRIAVHVPPNASRATKKTAKPVVNFSTHGSGGGGTPPRVAVLQGSAERGQAVQRQVGDPGIVSGQGGRGHAGHDGHRLAADLQQ